MPPPLQMYGFWRSQATYRLRVAMNLKSIAYTEKPINLEAGEQHSASFLKVNPLGSVPALMINVEDGTDAQEPLTQSLAVLEYLEETHPNPPLLPSDPLQRARVRSLSAIVASDSHPLIVPRVRNYLQKHEGFDAKQWRAWQTHWLTTALQGFEARLRNDKLTGKYCHGDEPTIADICLVAFVLTTRTFEIRVDEIPIVDSIVGRCEALDAFERAKAEYQSDFPGQR